MENQNKLDNQFKNAAGKVENKGFDRMEAIWDRVEEKLDHKKKRRGLVFWRYGGIAAMLLILLAIGGQFFKKHANPIEPELNPETQVTTIDHNKVEETFNPTTVRDTQKIEVVVGEGNNTTYTIEADSIHFDPVTKKVIVWNSKTDKGETTPKKDDVVYTDNTSFTTGKNNESPDYEFRTDKVKIVPSKKVVVGHTVMYIDTSSATAYSNVALQDTENENLNEFIVPAKDKYTHLNSLYFGKDTITGIVSDETGPLPSVNVYIKGTNQVVQTDLDGKYTIVAKAGDTLDFAFIGYNSQTVAVNENNKEVNIQLSEGIQLNEVVKDVYRSVTVYKSAMAVATTIEGEYIDNKDNEALEEVVVTGYGTQKRTKEKRRKKRAEQEATIAFAKRKSRDGDKQTTSYVSAPKGELDKGIEPLEDRANTSVIQSLQEEIAGLNTATEGDPSANSTIVLRGIGTISGNAEPLFIVDGVPVDEATFRNLNQNDITSAQVLKDAAATSIYGNRGANGVIVITTTKGTTLNLNTAALDNQSDSEKRALLQGVVTTRGNSTPLYILDGMPVDEETVKNMNVNDVANIRVIKDAGATSLYGMRGSNGVVVIKTKQGEYAREIIEEDEEENEPIDPSKIQVDRESYNMFEENQFENPTTNPLSTFSIDVDNASYTNIRRFLNNRQKVPKDAVRVEEMINFFKYDYPQPKGKEPFSINTEYSDAPWNPDHKLLKIGLKGKEIPMDELPASNFVFLIDVSGSMSDDNKLPLLKQSMKLLVNQMRREDKIAIVVYAGAAGLVLPSTNGSEKTKIIDALDELSAGGSTAGGEGIELAYKTAQENFIKGGNNRVILATDGDFNVGDSSDRDMQTLIEEKRQSGVFLTCLGYGMGNYKDSKMEILADKGNGNYAYIDNMQEADRFLQKEFKGSMYAIAKDVKIQIEFNPNHVQSYRLIGYENRKLRDQDFENDAIDAGELGSGHTVTALYEIIPVGVESDYFTPDTKLKYTQQAKEKNKYKDELATVKLRHKKPDGNKSTETELVIENKPVELDEASADFKFAASVAWFGLKLRDSELIPSKSSKKIKKLAKEGIKNDTDGYKAEFIRLVNMVQ